MDMILPLGTRMINASGAVFAVNTTNATSYICCHLESNEYILNNTHSTKTAHCSGCYSRYYLQIGNFKNMLCTASHVCEYSWLYFTNKRVASDTNSLKRGIIGTIQENAAPDSCDVLLLFVHIFAM